LSWTNRHHNAEAVAGRVLDLGEPPLTPVELRTATHLAPAGLDAAKYPVQAAG
jgi:hypothetical protein